MLKYYVIFSYVIKKKNHCKSSCFLRDINAAMHTPSKRKLGTEQPATINQGTVKHLPASMNLK